MAIAAAASIRVRAMIASDPATVVRRASWHLDGDRDGEDDGHDRRRRRRGEARWDESRLDESESEKATG